MLEFIIFSTGLLLAQTLYSLKDYKKYEYVYEKMLSMKFERFNSIFIANNNTKEEFVVISEWNFKITPNDYLQFDIWTLIDFHKLYWILKFHKAANKMGLITT
jgi:hypothetical protein